ncbi:hypothetical protein [Flavivirga algicola]|uniref:Lipoprotein n=1 Tax=Flavivirga algicola TaxID=2729136 RepID=A0ABX1RT19_9FLAO|nr:hypothetical protein [Flavivirga algicola]NMH86228.1 hypothetical protein [Flavivirga algicola]
MKQYLFLTILTLTIFSCKETNQQNKQIIQGDIYIKLIDFQSIIYNLPDEELKKFKEGITNPNQNNYSDSEKKSSEYFKILIEHDLFGKPFFKLKTKSEKIINVYTTENEYLKLKKELKDLDRDKQKITVQFEGNKISNGIFDADKIFDQAIYETKKIISIKKTQGKTYWDK